MTLSEMITTLRSLDRQLASLAVDIKNLRLTIALIVMVGMTIIGIIVAIKP